MKPIRFLLSLLMLACVGPLWAQGLSDAQIAVERERIGEQRRANDARHAQERTACYQRFAVEDCLRESRQRLRHQTDDLRRQESALNDTQRKRRGAEQLQRLDEKKSQAPAPAGGPLQQDAGEAQRSREDRADEHASSRAAMEAEAGKNRADFDARQRQRADDAASTAQRRAAAPIARDRYQRKQVDAQRRRAERERTNAERQKPPSPALPVPATAQ